MESPAAATGPVVMVVSIVVVVEEEVERMQLPAALAALAS
jgi:hypothetical protein